MTDIVRRAQGDAVGAFGLDPSESSYRIVASGTHWCLRDYLIWRRICHPPPIPSRTSWARVGQQTTPSPVRGRRALCWSREPRLPGCLVVGRDGADNQRNHARGIVQGASPAIGRNLDIGAAVIRFGGSDSWPRGGRQAPPSGPFSSLTTTSRFCNGSRERCRLGASRSELP